MSSFSTTAMVTFLGYILLYGVCWGTDKTDIDKHKKKIKLDKYTSILFFLWQRNEKVYWLIYIIIITESVVFILVWISYFLNVVFLYKILIDLYIRIYLSGMVVLGVIILKKRIKDFISGKSR
ncbi:hypothetical protein HMPREF1495_0890 [Lachnoanaerobaculum sp. MSX33]|uniref:hypothetical protein n=1 Tax=Lachnoanaerobaculum sp. MSX33 TaxID=936596 RepID=UPI0003DF84D4|nr:hypothetical protein [Lachnoanaerobaculum sp. MSX33]ETO97678.1 hypothetical protein HMPREF1495_0890 [Lachnoanaerobaculum sp. MSX33]